MPFDRVAAKQAGYTDAEIDQYLATQAQSVTIPSGPMQTGQIIPPQQPQQFPQLPQGMSLGNVLEPALTMGSGMVAEPLAGLAGIASLPFGAEQAAQNVATTREALTIPPLSQEGTQGLQAIGGAMQPVGEALQALQQGAGDIGYDVAGPIGGAIGETLPTAAISALGFAPVRKVANLGKSGADRTVKRLLGEATPTVENLKQTARGIYNELDDIGAIVDSRRISGLGNELGKRVAREGLDPALHPKSSAAFKRISDAQGTDLNLTELDTLRKIAKDAASSIEPSDARIGAIMVDKIDDLLDSLKPSDFVKGKAEGVGAKYRDARQLWQRAKKSELLDDAFERAGLQASGFENGIRTQFRSLLNNKKKMRGFTSEEKAAMRQVVQGGTAENIAKRLGKLGFGEGQATSMLMGSLGVAGGAAIGGAPGAVAVPLIGQVSRNLAQKLTRNNAHLSNQIVKAGPNGKKVVEAYIRSVPAKQRDVAELTELLMRPDVSLKALKKTITNPTPAQKISADAVFFADFLRSQQENEAINGQ